ncbi:T9SS type A sorting domain-containing protein [Flavobacterium sp. LMO8]|uniref:T9SS type A sorting domain-containing protein n=1 Tax=Flavobacterium sp. LMO8 TaxID=2654244 RepID=UPI001291C317|nr:T9SS type A sorting domain-containing protein [Flavobacterium sp. LMO8]MQP24740.1 T9SS type A sorting domain-containing protein [Flavobacterium sp. LMO8]
MIYKITPTLISIKKIFLFAVLLSFNLALKAQVVDDYRTVDSGNWDALSVWERYNGTSWEPASVIPNRTVNGIAIRDGHTITISSNVSADQLIVETNSILILTAKLTVFDGVGTDFLLLGKLIHNASGRFSFNSMSASLIVASLGVYQYNRSFTATIGLPTGLQTTWNDGSVCSITNDISNSTFFDGHQFSVLEIDYSTGTAIRSIEANWGSVAVLKIKNTGTRGIFSISNSVGTTDISVEELEVSGGRLHVFASGSSGNKTFTVTGNVIQSGGVLSVCSNDVLGNYLMKVNGNYTITGGTTNISNANGTSSRIADLQVDGDVAISIGTLQLATGNSSVTNDGRLILGSNLTLSSGALAFNQSRTTGVSGIYFNGTGNVNFTWSGGTLGTGNGKIGRRFYFNNSGVITGLNEIYSGASSQTTIDGSQGVPSAGYVSWPSTGTILQNLTINNAFGVVLRSKKTVNGNLNLLSGKLTLGNNNLTLANSNGLIGGSEINYIVTNGNGNFIRTVGGIGSYFFPIGSNTDYNGAMITWASVPGITKLSSRYVASTVTLGTGLPLTHECFTATELLDNGYWIFNSTGTLANLPQLSFTRNGHTNAGLSISNHAILNRVSGSSDWQIAGDWNNSGSVLVSPVNIGTVELIQNNGTSFGEFAIAKGNISNLEATVVIDTVPSGTVCSGTTLNFTAIPTNGGTSPAYQWFLNGVAIPGANSEVYSTSTLEDSDVISVEMTSNQLCVENPTVSSSGFVVSFLTNTWLGTTNAFWDEPSNWSCGIVPNDTNSILIDTNSPNIPILNIDLTIGVNSIFTISGSGQLVIDSQHTLSVLGTANFNGRPILMKSNSSGTAMLGTVTGTVTGATNVTVERYIPLGKRAFRFLSSSVNSTGSLSETWQMSTHITGVGGDVNGFDTTTTNSSSLYLYNNQIPSGTGWYAASNTNATNLEIGKGYRMLIRGDRTPELITSTSAENMNAPITLFATGSLFIGDFVFNSSSSVPINNTTNSTTDNGSLIGNPYQSAVDWHSVTKTGIQDVYYAWDANMGSGSERGRYVAYSQSTGVNNEPASSVNRYIQPGQALFVKNAISGVAGTLVFKETDKQSVNSSVFRTEQTLESVFSSMLSISLYESSILSTGGFPLDGSVAVFGSSFLNDIDSSDVKKLEAPGENLAWYQSSTKLAIASYNMPQQNSICELKILRLKANKNYTFKIVTSGFSSDLSAILIDSFTGNQTLIQLNEVVNILFTTTSELASQDENRFSIHFQSVVLGESLLDSEQISVFPNPILNNEFSLILPINTNEPIQVVMYSILGQSVYKNKFDSQSVLKISPNVKLEAGIYIVEVTIGENVMKKKIVIK